MIRDHRFVLCAFFSLCSLASIPACAGAGGDTSTEAPIVEPAAQTQAQEEDPPTSVWTGGRVRGLASKPANGVTPPGAKIQVSLRESDTATFDSKIIYTHEAELSGDGPWAFEFSIDESMFNVMNGYGISAMVVDGEGAAWFMSQPVKVFRAEEPDAAVEIVLDPADPRAVVE